MYRKSLVYTLELGNGDYQNIQTSIHVWPLGGFQGGLYFEK